MPLNLTMFYKVQIRVSFFCFLSPRPSEGVWQHLRYVSWSKPMSVVLDLWLEVRDLNHTAIHVP